MKYLFKVLCFILCINSVFAQVPQSIPYQAVARNYSGSLISNHLIHVRFTIHDSIPSGSILYQETQTDTTTNIGLFNMNIGSGSIISGTFSAINWGINKKYLQVEVDTSSGASYIDFGTQQMLSVPYALYSGLASGISGGFTTFTHYVGEIFGGGIVIDVYKDSTGEHGIIASLTDLETYQQWSNVTTYASYANSIIDGYANSNTIISQTGHVSSAASLCRTYTGGGFTDWYLPSIIELKLIYNQQFIIDELLPSGNLSWWGTYWSSTENDASDALGVQFNSGNYTSSPKTNTNSVRAIRKF